MSTRRTRDFDVAVVGKCAQFVRFLARNQRETPPVAGWFPSRAGVSIGRKGGSLPTHGRRPEAEKDGDTSKRQDQPKAETDGKTSQDQPESEPKTDGKSSKRQRRSKAKKGGKTSKRQRRSEAENDLR